MEKCYFCNTNDAIEMIERKFHKFKNVKLGSPGYNTNIYDVTEVNIPICSGCKKLKERDATFTAISGVIGSIPGLLFFIRGCRVHGWMEKSVPDALKDILIGAGYSMAIIITLWIIAYYIFKLILKLSGKSISGELRMKEEKHPAVQNLLRTGWSNGIPGGAVLTPQRKDS